MEPTSGVDRKALLAESRAVLAVAKRFARALGPGFDSSNAKQIAALTTAMELYRLVDAQTREGRRRPVMDDPPATPPKQDVLAREPGPWVPRLVSGDTVFLTRLPDENGHEGRSGYVRHVEPSYTHPGYYILVYSVWTDGKLEERQQRVTSIADGTVPGHGVVVRPSGDTYKRLFPTVVQTLDQLARETR